jgi:hypothetical protein
VEGAVGTLGTVAPTGLRDALGRLAPEERAVLELSIRRGLHDAVLAELLRLEAEVVGRRRRSALRRLAAALDVPGGVPLETALRELWGEEDAEPAPTPPAAEKPDRARPAPSGVAERRGAAGPESGVAERRGAAAPERVRRAPPRPAERRRDAEAPPARRPAPTAVVRRPLRRTGAVAALVASAAAGAAIAALVIREDGSTPVLGPGSLEPGAGPIVRLSQVGAPSGRAGTAQVVQSARRPRVRLWLRGLPRRPRGYGIWLYDSPAKARRLVQFRGPGVRLEVALPVGFRHYRAIDVSAERATSGPRHAGPSVLRVRMRPLLRGVVPVRDGPPRSLKL